jgi:CubicO group peptidase (beta-lactamase class C family)
VGALEQIEGWPPSLVAAAVAGRRGVIDGRGPTETPMRWASVTKLATALAVLVAVEEGDVELDQPAGPEGATLRHLLSHASGLGMDDDRPLVAPGVRRIYSNRGIDLAAATVATATGMDFARYLAEAVLEPLGMTATSLPGSPAASMVGPVDDLVRLGAELLMPTLIDRSTLDLATSVAFPGLNGVLPGFGVQRPNDWGLGFEIRDGKAPHWTGATHAPSTFGHFGQAGGFLWVDPVAGLACACLSDLDFGAWAAAAWPKFSDDVLVTYGPQGG